MIKLNTLLNHVLHEGGVGGHIAHPFDFTKNGKQLVNVFIKSIESLKIGVGSVKIDGVNVSIRVVNGRFVMDRGSAKPYDVQGMRPKDLAARWPTDLETGVEHGFVKIGAKVINIFDDAISSTQAELKNLGLSTNPNILLNIEYVEGQTNVIGYGDFGNFLAIHGLKEIKPKNIGKDSLVKSRVTTEIPYNKTTMRIYINKLNVVAQKYGFKVLGSVGTAFKSEPNLTRPLGENVTLYPNGIAVTKPLKDWLKSVTIETPLITRELFLKAQMSKNISKDFAGQDIRKVINDTVVYIATIKLGDEILKNATSEIGDLAKHEGIVIRDPKIYTSPFKITGSFITKGLQSIFKK